MSAAGFVRHLATQAAKEVGQKRLGLANVAHVIAVASGKGGVGKSTTAVNIAVALSTCLGLRTGLLDADVLGPSVPLLMNLRGKPAVKDSGLMRPLENYRVQVMSMGLFMEGDAPVAWRGPMVTRAFDKLLFGADWGPLDVLVVDMPPGTGDAQINLGQRIPLSGAAIISTPQDVALLDARRGAQMFRQMRVPLLGMIENMSHYECRSCGHKEHIFGEGGVPRAAAELGLDVLGQVPLDVAIRVKSDQGAPIVVSEPSSPSSRAYIAIAQRIWDKLQAAGGADGGGGPAQEEGGHVPQQRHHGPPTIVVD